MSVTTAFPAFGRAAPALLVLALVGFLTSMDVTMTTILIQPMKRELGLTDLQIGLLQGTAYGLAYGVCAMPIGRLIDSLSRTRLMVVGLLLWAACMAGNGLAHGFALLLVYRAGLGMLAALLQPASLSLIADLFAPARRPVATSMFVVGQAFGAATGILAGGLLFDALGRLLASQGGHVLGLAPWRLLYIGAGAVCLGLVLPLALTREPARQERLRATASTREALGELWTYRGFLAPLVAALVFIMIATEATSVWVAPLLTRKFGLTPGQFAGWLSAMTLAGGILGTLAGGRLAGLSQRRGGGRGVLLPALFGAVMIALFSLFALMPRVGLFAVLLAPVLFCAGLIPTVGVIAFTLNIPNEIRALAIGVYALAGAVLGTATAPAAIALVSRALGGENMLSEAFTLVVAPSAIASALLFGVTIRGGARRRLPGEVAPSP